MSDLDECAKRVGTSVRDKWKLERLLGVGGMAAVYVAVHKIGRRDAIKILHTEIAKSPEVRARFEQEAHAVNRFKHPGAVEIRDIDVTEDGAPFLVMELLEGDTLSRIARRDPGPTVDDVLRWADELLDVLVAAHAQGIVHRDIKPDNLFVLKDGRLKVLDFGIARIRSRAAGHMKTATGTTIGTVSYMPPEQAKGSDIDARADIFAVGATMFRLISKRKIHEAENDLELLKKVATEQAPPLASVFPFASDAVCKIVDRALKFDREARYADAASMQADVRAARSAPAPSSAKPQSAPSPLAMSIDPPASGVVVPPEIIPPAALLSTEAPTVGTPRIPSSSTDVDAEPPPMSQAVTSTREAIPSTAAMRVETTLRSGPPPAGEPELPVIPPSPPPPQAPAFAPAHPVSAPPAFAPPDAIARDGSTQRGKSRLLLIVAGAVLAVLFVVGLAFLVVTVLVVKTAAEIDNLDAATDTDAATTDAIAPDDYAPSTSAAAPPPATHKPTATPTPKPAPPPPPKPSHPHKP